MLTTSGRKNIVHKVHLVKKRSVTGKQKFDEPSCTAQEVTVLTVLASLLNHLNTVSLPLVIIGGEF